MKPLPLIAASALALAAAACGPQVPAARAALDCPASQGDLTRTSATADGKACTYAASTGAEVTLQLVPVAGGVDQTLAAIEKTLLADRTPAAPAAEGAATTPATTGDAPSPVEAVASESVDARKARAEAEADARSASVEVQVRVAGRDGGRDGEVRSNEGTTRVSLPGISIVANEKDESANIKVGPITVNANGEAAIIRVGPRDVRLRGEQLNPEKRGTRAMFIYTGQDLPEGYRFVGYEAGGPKRGPITVAIVKSKSEGPRGDEIYPDVKKLVRKNGGV
ncbi:hypothetical protein [Phenylobacterium sp.]|uniref:hypothetical protein n=1 Tax=Phenylobacterium sp. TaxID=1871053 RepID=UPI00301D807E